MTFTPAALCEYPYDPLGREYFETFTAFVKNNELCTYPVAKGSQLTVKTLATDIFSLRYSLAHKYNTFFAKQMVQDGVLYWKRRFEGTSRSLSYSWGIRKHPRSGELWKCLDLSSEFGQFKAEVHSYHFGTVDAPLVPDLPTFTGMHTCRVWRMMVCPSLNEQCLVIRPIHNPDLFLIVHVHDGDVPSMVHMCEYYFGQARDESIDLERRIEMLARFEYLWFWANPFGRAGAITGDAISFLVQKEMIFNHGHDIVTRQAYLHQDFFAFSMSLDAYIENRKAALFPRNLLVKA
jgi:hypothetical protein